MTPKISHTDADSPFVSRTNTTSPSTREASPDHPRRARACASCDEPARFITPVGLFCGTHAMSATLHQEKGSDRWMPVPIQDVGEGGD